MKHDNTIISGVRRCRIYIPYTLSNVNADLEETIKRNHAWKAPAKKDC